MDRILVISLTIVLPFSRPQQHFSTTSHAPYGDCERFEEGDLGPVATANSSVPSLLFDVLYGDQPNRALYQLYINEVVITCWAPSFRRGYYSSVTFIARYHCDGPLCPMMGEQVQRIHFVCNPNGNIWSRERTTNPEIPHSTEILDPSIPLNTLLSRYPEVEVCGACLVPRGWGVYSTGKFNRDTGCVGKSIFSC